MAKIHTSMPDELYAELNRVCEEFGYERAKLLQRGLRLALNEVEAWNRGKTLQEAEGQSALPPPEPAPAVPLPPPPPSSVESVEPARGISATQSPEPFDIAWVRRGDGLWLRLDQLLDVLKVRPEVLLAEIDEADDVLEYAGQRWVDSRGLAEARTLCRDPDLGDRVQAWVDLKAFNPQPDAA